MNTEPGRELADVLADARGDAAVLRRSGNAGQAEYVEALCDQIADAAGDYLRWLSEGDAFLKSGLAPRTLHRRFRDLHECGLARYNAKREREYRACAVPSRPDVADARERGRQIA